MIELTMRNARNVRRAEYNAWHNMKSRCNNSRSPHFVNYGGRGIGYDPRWESFDAFYADMGDCPYGYTLERSENELDYSPSNCVWATRTEQLYNRRQYKTNTSGVTGVHQNQRTGAWVASQGRNTLYYGPSFDDAVAARKGWEHSNL